MTSFGIVGCGRFGEAVLAGMLRGGVVDRDDVVVTARRDERVAELIDRHGVAATTDNPRAASADVVMLGLKPQTLPRVLGELGAYVRQEALVVSLVAGTTTASLDRLLPHDPAIVRVMSNTAAMVSSAVSVVSGGPRATDEHLGHVEHLLSPLGVVRRLPESSIDAVTAISGSGPAYVFLLAEAMAEAGVLAGLDREDAVALVNGTIAGAGAMLTADVGSATELREQVTSPGGITAEALRELERCGLRVAMLDAVEAAVRRARELA